jgi:translin
MQLYLGIKEIEKQLSRKEEAYDTVHSESRIVVRSCSNAIKSLHAHDFTAAKKHLKEAEEGLEAIRKFEVDFPSHIDHVLQEYAEAQIVLSATEKKKIPSFKEMGMGEVPYLNGLLDAIGELKREMYESLRSGKKEQAKEFFELMEAIYDELLPLRFSNAILPEFRRKQDVGRMQIEQARGELL